MSRLGWAFVGLVAGAVFAGCLALVQIDLLGHVNLRLTVVAGLGLAVGVLYWADESGRLKEPQAPPSLSLSAHDLSKTEDRGPSHSGPSSEGGSSSRPKMQG
jgi:hypothetical protein